MAQEITEKSRRMPSTTRATNPVWERMPVTSVAKIVVKRKMTRSSVTTEIFLGV